MAETAKSDGSQPAASARILYLGLVDDAPVQKMKLAGARRYADARRWEVVPFEKSDSGPRQIRALLARHRPIGCIADCAGKEPYIPSSLFGRVPAVWLDIPSGAPDGQPSRRSVFVDNEAVARTAMRELSAIRPESFAVVDFQWHPHEESPAWSLARMAAFKATVAATGRPCAAFESRTDESPDGRIARLAAWISRLPRPCGVFAVNDGAAHHVRAACLAAKLRVPGDIAIIGVDNDPSLCEKSEPFLSSIQIDFERAGYVAAKMLGGESTAVSFGPLLAMRRKSTSGRDGTSIASSKRWR